MSHTLRLRCTRADADRLAAVDLDLPGTLAASERADGRWYATLYLDDEPDPATIAAFAALLPDAGAPIADRLPDADWVTLSQAGLSPVEVGRFHIHTREHPGICRPGQRDLLIDAGLAFGTGRHDTTTGCLRALQRLARTRKPRRVLDVGTGTGILAMAAADLWPEAEVTASDIDPVAIHVAGENLMVNRFIVGQGRGRIRLLVAPGAEHRRLRRPRQFDVIVANVLANPLVMLAPQLIWSLKPGGVLLLAGLLQAQVPRVGAAYAARGLVRLGPVDRAGWPVLMFERRAVTGARRGTAGRRPTRSAW